MEERVDRRVLKTKKAIKDSVLVLLRDNNLEDIAITDIAKLANITRKSFYNSYENIGKVIDEIEDDIVNAFELVLNNISYKSDVGYANKIFEELTNIIQIEFNDYDRLVRENKIKNTSLINKLSSSLRNLLTQKIPTQLFVDESMKDLTVNFLVGGFMEVYSKWFDSPQSISLKCLAERMGQLTMLGLSGVIKDSVE